MKTSIAPFTERRQDPRVAASAPARFEASSGLWAQKGSAVIEDASACGLRLNSEEPLHPDESLILRVPGDALELHARVLWVREGRPRGFRSHKGWIAGCELLGDSISRARFSQPPGLRSRWLSVFFGKTVRVVLAIGILAVLVYLYWLFATLIGGRIMR